MGLIHSKLLRDLQIKAANAEPSEGGSAGGGGYGVQTYDLEGNIILAEAQVSWLVGEEK